MTRQSSDQPDPVTGEIDIREDQNRTRANTRKLGHRRLESFASLASANVTG